jgi:hypothetical protein
MKSTDELLEQQRKYVRENGDCTHYVHHAKTDAQRKDAEEMVRSGDPALAMLGMLMLEPCPNRRQVTS